MSSFYRRHSKGLIATGLILVAIVLLINFLTPYLVKRYLNQNVLNDMGDYHGYLNELDMGLLSGTAELRDLKIHRNGGDPDVPFVHLNEAKARVSYSSLFRGYFAVEVEVNEPEVNFLDAEVDERKQTGEGLQWPDIDLTDFPSFVVHEFRVNGGKVTFQNFDTEPQVNIAATHIDAVLSNLTNIEERRNGRITSAHMTATLLEDALARAEAELDPFDFTHFTFASEVTNLQLTQMNDFAEAYANLDFADGHGDFFVEMKADRGNLTGYVKPMLEEIRIFNWEQDVEESDQGALSVAWEGLTEFFSRVLTSPDSERLATQVDIEADLNDEEAGVDTWQAVTTTLRNAFIDALNVGFENLTSLTEDEGEEGGESDEG